MRDLQEAVWWDLKQAVEEFTKALEENTDIVLINSLAEKIKELQKRLSHMTSLVAGYFFSIQGPLKERPQAIVRMHLAESPDFV